MLSSEKMNLSYSGESSSSVEEQLLENVKPNLISLTSSGSYSSHPLSDMRNQIVGHSPANLQTMDEQQATDELGISLKDLETSLDSFTVILEEPVKSSQNSLNGNAADTGSLQNVEVSPGCESPATQSKHSVTTPDLLENCLKVYIDQSNGGKTPDKISRYLKRSWSSVQDLTNLHNSPLKTECEFTYLMHNPCQSSTTISSVQKSKDSGLPRSLSCLSFGSGVKPYDHIQSKVREYISQIKKTESERKKNVEMSCKKREDESSLNSSGRQEPEEDLRHVIYKLQQELNDKNNIITQIQENYDELLMKYADAENKIDRLRFKVIDSSVEEIRSQRTQDDYGIWNDVHSKNSFVNQSYSSRSGSHDVNTHFRRNLFQPSFVSGSSSLPSAANLKSGRQESHGGMFDNEAVPPLRTSADFLELIKRQEDSGPFLAFSTPNHSFSNPVVSNEVSKESKKSSLEKNVAGYESLEDGILVNCGKDCNVTNEEQNVKSEDMVLESHTPHNLSLRGTQSFVRSGDQETLATICNIVSDGLRERDTKSFLLNDFPDTEEYKTSSSETSILKVKQWQESLPPVEQREPSYDMLTSNFSNNKIRSVARNTLGTERKRINSTPKKFSASGNSSLENKNPGTAIPRQRTSHNSTNENISTVCLGSSRNSQCPKNLFTSRSFSKNVNNNFHLSHVRFCRSEPDLRLVTVLSDGDFETKRQFENNFKLNSERLHQNVASQETKMKTSYEIGPLQIEPCYCWEKVTLDIQNKPQLNHCSSYALKGESNRSENTVPRLKLEDLIDLNMDSMHRILDANEVNNSNFASFIYSPSTSVSSTAVYSGRKRNALEKHLKPSEDPSTSYKNIQRKNKLPENTKQNNVCYSKLHCGQRKSFEDELCPYVCQMNCMCHNCRNGEHSKHAINLPHFAVNNICCSCSSPVVAKHSCGVNTENDTTLLARHTERTLHKPTSYPACSCGVNTETEGLTENPTDHIEFIAHGGVIYQKKDDGISCDRNVKSKTENNVSKHSMLIHGVQPAINMSSEQSHSVIADKGACDLALCLEEVNHIASLLKAQSESIIEVVTTNLANSMGKETAIIDMSDLA